VLLLAVTPAGRLAEAPGTPRALVEVGGRPLIWHSMKHLGGHGLRDFAIALGGGDAARRALLDAIESPDGGSGRQRAVEVVDVAAVSLTAARIRRLALSGGTSVVVAGDVLSDIDVEELLRFHRGHGRPATVVAVRPPARFGRLALAGDQVVDFAEKPQAEQGWVSGGLLVLEGPAFDHVEGDDESWETQTLARLADRGQLMAYKHASFWLRLETLRDKQELESLWRSGNPPWKTWE
jgi:glucose-1-phosphate cytidylyltransferase